MGALARELQQAACSTCRPSRRGASAVVPVLHDRVLEVAIALEHAQDADPSCVALIQELLRDGASPLYNLNVRADRLHATRPPRPHRTQRPTARLTIEAVGRLPGSAALGAVRRAARQRLLG
jgi:hypothetical protein